MRKKVSGGRIVRTTYAFIAAVTVAVFGIASAHHSATIFDRQSVVAFQGSVTRFSWTNPHVYIYVETRDDAGGVVEWEIETDATPILARSGWTADSLVPGDRVTVRANPDRNVERRHGLLVSVSKGDGATLTARSYFLRAADDTQSLARAADMSGIWELSVLDFEPFYEVWAQVDLTPKAIAAQAAYDIRAENPVAQCIAPPTPTILVAPYLNEIVLGEDVILIRNERFNIERTIHMDGRGHPDGGERSNQGHSIGRWEGDVLVVDTMNFSENRAPIYGRPARAEGVPSGLGKHVVEKFRLSEDRTHIAIDFSWEDPEYLAEPFTGTVRWYYAPHFEMLGFDCDSDNARRFSGQ
jgi:hypothetical protein